MSNNSKLFRLTVFVMLAILAGILLAVGAFSANAETDCPNGADCYPTKTLTATATITPTVIPPSVTPTATSTLPTPAPTFEVTPDPWYGLFLPMFYSCQEFTWQFVSDPVYGYWVQVCDGYEAMP